MAMGMQPVSAKAATSRAVMERVRWCMSGFSSGHLLRVRNRQ